MAENELEEAEHDQRRRDRGVSALICALLAILAVFLWAIDRQTAQNASAFTAAPTCAGSPSSNCRALAAAHIVEHTVDGSGHHHLMVSGGAQVTLAANTPSEWIPTSAASVAAVTWEGQVVEIDTADGHALLSATSPLAQAQGDSVVLGFALATMVMIAAANVPLLQVLRAVRGVGRRVPRPEESDGGDAADGETGPKPDPGAPGAPPASTPAPAA